MGPRTLIDPIYWACIGLALGYSSMCLGVPRGLPRPDLNMSDYHCNTPSFVNFTSGGAGCGLCGISSSTAFVVSSAYTLK